MPDFTMCASLECRIADMCFRSTKSGTAPSEHNQLWSDFYSDKGEDCAHFWECSASLGLKNSLRRMGLTQTDFAKHVGVNPRTVRRWVSNESVVPVYALYVLNILKTAKRS